MPLMTDNPNDSTPMWQRGEQAELARLASVSPQLVSDIVHCRCRAGAETALKLELAAATMGLALTRDDFVWPERSESPLVTKPTSTG